MTEQQIEQQKEAVASMRSAQAHMRSALGRIEHLELALKSAASDLDTAASFIADNVYKYNSTTRAKDLVKEFAASARKAL